MLTTDTVAADLVAASSVIDDMEAAALHGAASPSRLFLAAYQAKLGSASTPRGMDLQFLTHFKTYFNRKGLDT